ncbi:MAG: GIY-YIG nuclease family protein [Kiloniellales bacterium]|nr:GIY-YIG nuclease family protein [Kiloniellales bacterium]
MPYYVYIMASKPYGTLYVGMTGDLVRRVYQHKNGVVEGFTNQYGVHRLVYFEQTDDVRSALQREKSLKRWNRDWKIALIEKHNPDWHDLSDTLVSG